MPRNAFGDDDSAWSLPTTNGPHGAQNEAPNGQFPAQAPTLGAPPTNTGPPSWSFQQPGTSDAASPFGGTSGTSADFEGHPGGPVGAPRQWLAAAAGAVVLGGVIGLLAAGKPVLSVVGWLLAGAVAIGLLAVFTLQDTRRRASIWYTGNQSVAVVRNAILAVAVLVVALNAWQFADWAARR